MKPSTPETPDDAIPHADTVLMVMEKACLLRLNRRAAELAKQKQLLWDNTLGSVRNAILDAADNGQSFVVVLVDQITTENLVKLLKERKFVVEIKQAGVVRSKELLSGVVSNGTTFEEGVGTALLCGCSEASIADQLTIGWRQTKMMEFPPER